MKKYVVIVAGGKGTRMSSDIPKQFLLLAGKPVLMHSIEAFYNYDKDIEIIVVLPKGQQEYWLELCVKHKFNINHLFAVGGETRYHSVKNGLSLIDKDSNSLVAVHDGVRPLVSQKTIEELFDVANEYRAAYPALPVTDTIRKAMPSGRTRLMDRSLFYTVQTPQVFKSRILISSYQGDYSPELTDDISVVGRARNLHPMMVIGDKENIKITTPTDLLFAEAVLKCRISPNNR